MREPRLRVTIELIIMYCAYVLTMQYRWLTRVAVEPFMCFSINDCNTLPKVLSWATQDMQTDIWLYVELHVILYDNIYEK